MDIDKKLRQAQENFNRILMNPKSTILQRSYEEGYLDAIKEIYNEINKEEKES